LMNVSKPVSRVLEVSHLDSVFKMSCGVAALPVIHRRYFATMAA